MTEANLATGVLQWSTKSGSVWARRWRDTDRGLAGLSPHLLSTVESCAPGRPFRAFDVGCGPGTTTLEVAVACPEAEIIACDVSSDLAAIARERSSGIPRIRIVEGDAEDLAGSEGPFDLFFSRHGVMFFPDPVGAFRRLRAAANPGAAMVFSCFQDWELNPWASELTMAAAGKPLPPPGREPSGFAFSEPAYVREILEASGWTDANPRDVRFDYVAGDGPDPVGSALSLFGELGPASRLIESLSDDDRGAALERMRRIIERHQPNGKVIFPAAAWVWSAKA